MSIEHPQNTESLTFRYMIDFYAKQQDGDNVSVLYVLLNDKKLINEVVKTKLIADDEIQYLFKSIKDPHSLMSLTKPSCHSLLMHIYDNMLLDKKSVNKFNDIISKTQRGKELLELETFFDLVEFNIQNDWSARWGKKYTENLKCDNDALLSTNESYKYILELDQRKFSSKKRRRLFEMIKTSKNARSILKSLAESNLLDLYSYDQLENLLTKDEKKKKNKFNL